jgi:hypothetical protein
MSPRAILARKIRPIRLRFSETTVIFRHIRATPFGGKAIVATEPFGLPSDPAKGGRKVF